MMTFTLSEQMVATIAEILAQAPYKTVAPVLAEMQKQITAQQKDDKQGLRAVE